MPKTILMITSENNLPQFHEKQNICKKKKEVVEKANAAPEEAGLFFCGTNRGRGEALPGTAPPAAPSAPGAERGNLPPIWRGAPGSQV